MVNCCLHFRNPENNQAACQALYCLIADVYKNSETSWHVTAISSFFYAAKSGQESPPVCLENSLTKELIHKVLQWEWQTWNIKFCVLPQTKVCEELHLEDWTGNLHVQSKSTAKILNRGLKFERDVPQICQANTIRCWELIVSFQEGGFSNANVSSF